MSLNGIKLLCATVATTDPNGVPVYQTFYRVSRSVNGHIDGAVVVPVEGQSESTFNATVQQAVADKANAETSGVEEFTSADVYGGRI